MLAAAILLAVILYLVDKNQQWPAFWRFVRRGTATLVALAILTVIGFYSYEKYEAKKAAPSLQVKWDDEQPQARR